MASYRLATSVQEADQDLTLCCSRAGEVRRMMGNATHTSLMLVKTLDTCNEGQPLICVNRKSKDTANPESARNGRISKMIYDSLKKHISSKAVQ